MNATLDSSPAPSRIWPVITVAHGLLLAIGAAAAVLRLTELARLPLSPDEAGQALSAYAVWHPATVAPGGSPLYTHLTAALIPILGDSDTVMRLIPALAGLSLVIAPWLLRHRLGVFGALTTSLLLALSPLHNAAARTAGGEALALAAGVWLVMAGWRWLDSAEPRWFLLAVAAFALGLTSAPLFYNLLLSLGVALLLQRLVGPSLTARWPTPTPPLRRQALALGATLFLVVGAGILWRPAGLGDVAALLTQWLGAFNANVTGILRVTPLLALGRYEPALVTLGLAAILWATWRGAAEALLLVYWLAGSLILMFVQGGFLGNSLLMTLPAYLLVGLVTTWLAPWLAGRWWWLGSTITLTLAGLLWVNLVRFARVSNSQASAFLPFILTVLLVLVGLGVLLLLSLSLPGGGVLHGALVGSLVCLAFLNWGNSWQLSHAAANDPRERWVLTGSPGDVLLFRDLIRHISLQATGFDHGLDILSSIDAPTLRWYVRDFPAVTYVPAIPAGANATAIITPGEETPTLTGNYIATRLNWQTADGDTDLPRLADVVEILRWWFFHESPVEVEANSLSLWLNSARVNR